MREVAPTRSPVHPPEPPAQVRLRRGLLTAWAAPSTSDTGMQQPGISVSLISKQNFFPTANRGAGLPNSISTLWGERSHCLTNGISALPGPGIVCRRTRRDYPKREEIQSKEKWSMERAQEGHREALRRQACFHPKGQTVLTGAVRSEPRSALTSPVRTQQRGL